MAVGGNGGKDEGCRTRGEIERGGVRARVGQVLIGKHREVLGDHVTEVRSEDANIEASSIAHAKHRSGIELVGDANTRSNILEVLINVHGSVEWPGTRHAN